jgi:YHS domain-containing protein
LDERETVTKEKVKFVFRKEQKMKCKLFMIIAVLSLGVIFIRPVPAEEKGSHKGSMMDGEMTAEVTESGAIKVGNKICPVSKEKTDVMGGPVEYEYEGKSYNLCCKFCLKDFKKDPEKYIKMIEENLAGETPDEDDYDHDHGGHDH